MLRKHALNFAVSMTLGLGAVNSQAALVNGSTLNIGAGSYSAVQLSTDNFAIIPLVSHVGIVLGTSQATGASHPGVPTGTEAIATSIDEPWDFFANTGLHFTVSPTNVLSASGNTATVDMSGWRATWNGDAPTNLGSGAWNYPNVGWSGNVNGVAQITCGVDCGHGDTYTLQYTATMQMDSYFDGFPYGLKLMGTITAVPVPTTVWLFGSGLAALVVVA